VPHRFINELKPGDRIDDDVYLIRSKDLRTTTQGSLYIHAVLMDKTGQLVARMWQATEDIFNALPEGGFSRLKGRVEAYKGNPQFIIDAVRLADPGSFEISDYLAATKGDVEQMWSRLVEILEGIEHPDIAALVQAFLADKELMALFRKAPAAAAMHHAYIGGLLEHTLNLLEVALRVIPLYPQLSLDLVLCGLFLHDIGKAKELEFETAITYSVEGQLIGHISTAVNWVEVKAKEIGEKRGKPFPAQLKWGIQHIILSHHGQYEFGSSKLPAIPEAVAVHYLDNLDAKINLFLGEIENDRDPNSVWTNFNRAVATKILKSDVTGVREAANVD